MLKKFQKSEGLKKFSGAPGGIGWTLLKNSKFQYRTGVPMTYFFCKRCFILKNLVTSTYDDFIMT